MESFDIFFILGYYPFLEARSFSRVSLLSNRSLLRKDNFRGQLPEYIFALSVARVASCRKGGKAQNERGRIAHANPFHHALHPLVFSPSLPSETCHAGYAVGCYSS